MCPVKILFLSFTCEDIGVAMVTKWLANYKRASCSGVQPVLWKLKNSCLLCRNFISIYKINNITSPLGDMNFIFSCWKCLFQQEKIKFVSPRSHVISSIYPPTISKILPAKCQFQFKLKFLLWFARACPFRASFALHC